MKGDKTCMRIFDSMDFSSDKPLVIALGCFDGVHRGHSIVLSTARTKADELGIPFCIFAFEEPPRNFFSPCSIKLLTPKEEKLRLFEAADADIAVCVPFDEKILTVEAEDFVSKILLKNMRAEHLVCGYNYTFGKKALGNTELIKSICARQGVGVTVADDVTADGISVSSSAIRALLADGEVEKAASLLGRYYSISGKVINGQHLARKLGFPTVNIIPNDRQLIPKNGVYLTQISFCKEERFGITNVGIRPTVDTNIMCAETHIFDFDGDLYGKEITVRFIHFLRKETKFSSVEEMAEQVQKDIDVARSHAKNHRLIQR